LLPPCELVVVPVGAARLDPTVNLRLADLPFAVRVLDHPAADFAAALNSGVTAGHGHWLLGIEPPHALASDHLLSMVDLLCAHRAEWGFSACHWEPLGDVASEAVATRAASGAAMQKSIAEADTVGFALIRNEFVAVGNGAVMFSRPLFDLTGGFRDLPGHVMWDFAMRALWFAEPWYTAAPTYRHRISAHEPVQDPGAAGMTQVKFFRDYYSQACDDTCVPPNEFAPSLSRWGLHTLKQIFHCGHVLAFDLPAIEALAARIINVVESPTPVEWPSMDKSGVPVFISYAQNGEDAVLARVLADVDRGRYIDVGANDPDTHSVTRAFYDRGWSGINIEPVLAVHARLEAARTRDVNLAVAAGRIDGTIDLGEIAETGLSTTDPGVAARHGRSGYAVVHREVPMLTLDTIWQRHAAGEIHFLKIDVEGGESDVLAGIDLATRRPWVIVVEATAPLTNIPTHDAWEPRLLDAHYRFAHDDGLNRYYVAEEHAALIASFAASPTLPLIRAAELVALDQALAPARRFDPLGRPYLDSGVPEPTLARPDSQLCTRSQFHEPEYARWCRALREIPLLHRKQWEFVYVLQVLESAGLLQPGRRGLGFGCGREPLAAAMAAHGVEIVATALDPTAAAGHGWIETDQHATQLEDLNSRGICPAEIFAQRVRFQPANMNAIPEDFVDFDFVWSSCAFEHLGSIEHGLTFVRRAMRCLRPGGIAVHTTEFNLSSNTRTVESRDLSVFRRQDIERLVGQLEAEGQRVWPLNFNPGSNPVDRYVDLPPYRSEPHLKLQLGRFVLTSVGLVIQRGA
jgi:FkbM family methyltransferase